MDVELANTVIKPDEVPTEIQNNSDVALDSSWIAHAEQVEQPQGMTAAMSSPQSKTPAVVPSKKKIGRASCREREQITAVAVALDNKKQINTRPRAEAA